MTTNALVEDPETDVLDRAEPNVYLTRREAAALCRVPLSTFDSLRRQNRFPFPDAHMGKHMLWRASTVAAFLEAGGTRRVD
ncbi:helix-turn-helix transcriptional regulator [Microbacterium sp. LMI1x-1-1.1]|uniref:helix-turn-helix transcriptional regulator n=1 Tax=Microbacterium sp. LMI1x-1-1.1 TaxID=3135246 RepID=UPI003435241B